MKPKRHPHVCVVSSNPMCSSLANGIFLSSLFDGWPQDRISQIYFPAIATYPPEFDVCQDFRMVRASGWVQRFGPTDAACADQGGARCRADATMRGGRYLLQQVRKQQLMHRWLKLAQEVWYGNSWMSHVLQRELNDCRPDLVFAQLGNRCLTKLICQACEQLHLPLFIQVNDDFVTAMYEGQPMGEWLKRSSDYWFRRIVRLASGHAGVSPAMARTFATRYGASWDWFTTLMDASRYDPTPSVRDGTIKLIYTGNLGLNRWQTLRSLALRLVSIAENLQIKVKLTIYSHPEQIASHGSALNVAPITELRGWVSAEDLPRVFHQADILVHAESFDAPFADYTNLSFSTKLGQYMMAGRCILAIGPANSGAMQCIRSAASGVVIEDLDLDSQIKLIQQLLLNSSLRHNFARNGREWGLAHADTATGRERVRLAICAAIDRYNSSPVETHRVC